MKAMKGMKSMKKGVKSMGKGAIADAVGAACEKKRSEVSKVLDALADLAGKEVKGTGKFTIPGVCMIKKRYKPATKAGKRMAFGEMVKVKAKPARNVVSTRRRGECTRMMRSRASQSGSMTLMSDWTTDKS